jgi:hypothetical protein
MSHLGITIKACIKTSDWNSILSKILMYYLSEKDRAHKTTASHSAEILKNKNTESN